MASAPTKIQKQMPDRKTWIADLYQEILRPTDTPPPGWHNLPALGQLTITRPELLKPFAKHNRRHPDQAVRPGCFVSVCYPKPLVRAALLRLFAPYTTPARALNEIWYDLRSGDEYTITTDDHFGRIIPGVIPVKSYGDIASAYVTRPEVKFAYNRGECLTTSSGTLSRRHLNAVAVEHLGKEANLLGRRTEGGNSAQALQQVYLGKGLTEDELDRLAAIPRSYIAATTGISERSLREILARRRIPRATTVASFRKLLGDAAHGRVAGLQSAALPAHGITFSPSKKLLGNGDVGP
jgi:hypothetical protein